MKVRLIPVFQSGHEKAHSIRRSRIVVGRAKDCDLRLENPTVSRHHCELFVDNQELWIRDLGSSNGTFVNCQPVSEAQRLDDGDVLSVSADMYRVEVHSSRSGLHLLCDVGRALRKALT